jgi:hypothetical protein
MQRPEHRPVRGGIDVNSVVRNASGQAIAYLYSRENPAEARQAKALTADEARRIARNIARLPELLGKRGQVLAAPPPPMRKNHDTSFTSRVAA